MGVCGALARGTGGVEPQPCADGQRAAQERAWSFRHREKKLKRAHQVRRLVQQALALAQRLAHHSDLAMLQVAQPSVNDARGAAGSSRGEVVLLYQKHAPAPLGTLPSNGHAVDAAADYQDVKTLLTQRKCATHMYLYY